jgi:hypothetical protein
VARARIVSALLATILSLLARVAAADVAATGQFSAGAAPTLDGMIFFATGIRTVLGDSVDLAADVGDMSYQGTIQADATSLRGTFVLEAGPSTQFSFHAVGAAACGAPGCVDGTVTFGGVIDAIVDPMDVLPAATYTFDGTTYVSSGAPETPGGFAINAFAPQPTPAGVDVLTSSAPTTFLDSVQGIERTFEARVRFQEVSTAGMITFVAFSAPPIDVPVGYAIVPEVSAFIQVVPTGLAFSGDAEVCIAAGDADLDGVVDTLGVPVTEFRMLQVAAGGPAAGDVTGGSPPAGFVCGVVPTLSLFVLARTSGGPTTTTTIPGGGCSEPVACIDAVLGAPLCGTEAVPPKLQAFAEKKLRAAATAVGKAASGSEKKRARLLRKAGKQLDKLGGRADVFAEKKKTPITPACRDAIRAALERIAATLPATPSVAPPRGYPIFIP